MNRPTALFRVLVGVFACGAACAQTPPTTTQPATRPTAAPADAEPIMAHVIEVQGDVRHAPLGADEFKPCKVGDAYPQRTVILTGIRSSVKFQIGRDDTYTALLIEPASKTLISEAYTTASTKRVNIGVGYGRVRAGVVEGGLQSDFTIDSPAATLSKRGTYNFGMAYQRHPERFEIFQLGPGMTDAFSKINGISRELRTGEMVTDAMRRWLDQSSIMRNVPIPDILGQGDFEVSFNHMRQDGLRVLNPEGGYRVLLDLSSWHAQRAFTSFLGQQGFAPRPRATSRLRPEAFFGTGRGEDLIPLLITPKSDLVQRGYAEPGTYRIRRAALTAWLQNRRGG